MLDLSNITVNLVLRLFDYSYNMNLLKDRIALLRKETGWSKAELARQAETSRTAPTDWESGKVGDLSAAVAERISSKTKFSAMWLATGKGPKYKNDAGQPATDQPQVADWPFRKLDKDKILALSREDLLGLEGAIIYAAAKLGIDIKRAGKDDQIAI